MADLVIRGGTVVDGTGSPARRADVVIDQGRIVEVGRAATRGRREIDADGLVVTPGFVDIHTHFDGQATWDPILAPSSWHGVTSLAMGNCGVGFAPARPDRHEWLISLLEGVEDIPGTALSEGLSWGWESFPEYLDVLEGMARTVDVGAHVPHAALRTYVMGERGADHRERPSAEELVRMSDLVAEAIEAGALGFATSRTYVHRTAAGEPIPTLSAGDDELMAIAEALARTGGVTQLISDLYQTADDELANAELELIGRFLAVSGRPLSFTCQQAAHSPDRWRHQMGWIDAQVAAGHEVRAQIAPRPVGVVLGLTATANPLRISPTYRSLAGLELGEQVRRLADPELRRTIIAEHARRTAELEPGFVLQMTTAFDDMFVLDDPVDYRLDRSRSIGAEAARRGVAPIELVYDLLLAREGRQLLYLPLFNFARGDYGDLSEMLGRTNILLGLSDAGAHCGAISDASFTTSSIQLWAEQEGLERMVHLNTARNAAHVGWTDRGILAPGMLADVNLIDLEALACHPPELVNDLPAGGRRLVQRSEGYVATIKTGEVTFEQGEHTGALPGTLVRGARR